MSISFRIPNISSGLTLILLASALIVLAPSVHAQTVLSGDHSVDGFLCAGSECTNAEARNSLDTLRLKQDDVQIEIVDTTSGSGAGSTDWLLKFNSSSSGFFQVSDESASQDLVTIEAGAGANALYIDGAGEVGLGTSIPQAALHVETESASGIRLNRSNVSGGGQAWEAIIDGSGAFALADISNGGLPLGVLAGTPDSSLVFFPDGVTFNANGSDFDFAVNSTSETIVFADAALNRVGMGTGEPEAALHVARDDGTASVLIEDTSGTAAARQLLALRNNGQTFFSLEDTSRATGPDTGRTWNFQNLNGTFRVTTAPGGSGEVEMALDVDGNMTIEGNYLASSGTQLNVPDFVFEDDYPLRPLAEVAAYIDINKHLPDVPSAAEINAQGLNMTDMQMRLLQKIEELTLYTLALEEARIVQEAEIAEMRAHLKQVTDMR